MAALCFENFHFSESKRLLLRNSQNFEHYKYLWNVLVLREISQYTINIPEIFHVFTVF